MASICSRTRPIDEARDDLEYLTGIGDSPATGARVHGRITEVRREAYEEHDVDYGPVENVMISVRGAFARDLFTGPDGRYEFGRLPTGHYTLSVAPPSGFDTRYLERTFELRDRRACHAQDFAIRAIAGATGTVVDTQGRPVAGVLVDAVSTELAGYSPPPYQHPARTDASGRFAFDDLPPGDYVFGLNLTTRRATAAPGPALFFSGTTDPAAATVVVLKPGDEIELGELRMR
jgi:hypothetical protein